MRDRDSHPKTRTENAFGGRKKPHRRQHAALLGLALVVAVLSAGGYYLLDSDSADPLRALTGLSTPETVAASQQIPTATLTEQAVPIVTPSSAASTTQAATANPTTSHPTETAAATAPMSPTPVDRLTVGGINFVDEDTPLGLSYPKDWEGRAVETIDALQVLVSDDAGENLRAFGLISQWNGARKVFIYADLLIGSPVIAMHDGYYRNQPLEAEALRRLLEGKVGSPYAMDTIEENLARAVGERFIFRQGEREAAFVVEKAIRMNAQVTQEYVAKPGEVSTLLGPIDQPENAILLLICSARQPGEPEEVFPARFLVLLRHIP
ncbi:MAG: hypothetical protein ACYC4R_00750 [Anaerolineae bacterium]